MRQRRTDVVQGIVENTLPEGVQRFDQCRVPLAVSAFDVSRLTTRVVNEGRIAPALRATCTFPGLFAPVWHEQGVLVDGGIRDTTGARLTIAQRAGGLVLYPQGLGVVVQRVRFHASSKIFLRACDFQATLGLRLSQMTRFSLDRGGVLVLQNSARTIPFKAREQERCRAFCGVSTRLNTCHLHRGLVLKNCNS